MSLAISSFPSAKVESIEEDAVFHAFEIVLSIICFQSILVIEFIGSHEGLELEVLVFDKLGQFFQKIQDGTSE